MERRQDRLKLSCHIVCPDKSCLSVISIIFQNNKLFNNEKKNLQCNKFFLYNPPYHKHIEARMLMVRKTAKQFYIKKYSLSNVGIFLFSHPVARALSSALQGLTSVFGMGTGGPPASSTPTVDSEYSFGSPSWTRTNDNSVNSRVLSHTAFRSTFLQPSELWRTIHVERA